MLISFRLSRSFAPNKHTTEPNHDSYSLNLLKDIQQRMGVRVKDGLCSFAVHNIATPRLINLLRSLPTRKLRGVYHNAAPSGRASPVLLSVSRVSLSVSPVLLSASPVLLSASPVLLSAFPVLLSAFPVLLSAFPGIAFRIPGIAFRIPGIAFRE